MRSVTRIRIPPSSPSICSRFQPQIISKFRSRPAAKNHPSPATTCLLYQSSNRAFCSTRLLRQEDATARAKALHQKSADEHEDAFNSQIDNAIGQAKELQARTPWHREGSDKPPVKRMRSAGAMTKGSSLSSSQTPFTTHLTNTKSSSRQAPHHTLPPSKTYSPSNDPRQERRPKIN